MGAAAEFFFSPAADRDTLNKRVRPGDDQMEFLRLKKDALEAHLRRDLPQRTDCAVSTWLQGSYKLHTLIRPVHKRDEYDVDLGVYVAWETAAGERWSPEALRRHVQASVLAYTDAAGVLKGVDDPPKERCSRLKFTRQFHIDVPAYHVDPRSGLTRLATLSHGWERSDPEQMVQWFQARLDGDDRARVRRVVRYVKAWSALTFADQANARPSSLLLTVLCVDAFTARIGERDLDDDDLLHEIVTTIHERLRADRHVQNPVPADQDRDINRLDDAGFQTFMTALARLVDTARRACDGADDAMAATIWAEAFDYLFPLPDVEGLAESMPGQGILVPTPSIDIEVLSERGQSLRRYQGEADFVRIGETLRFRITNPQALPPQARIRWVVRNVGEQAYDENDLGHSVFDTGALVREERAAYLGRHFMDCEVYQAGRIRSITRVPVHITAQPMPARHRPRPAYRQLARR
jgi:Adenylyl/Guanylyl and SMODS C-terminal sensor domain/Second Messenger Oligonucleotide or Dinucleotide Synthetase domain